MKKDKTVYKQDLSEIDIYEHLKSIGYPNNLQGATIYLNIKQMEKVTEIENLLNRLNEEMKPIKEQLSSLVKKYNAIPLIKEIDGEYTIGLAIDESTAISLGAKYKVKGEEIGFNQEKLNEALTRVKTTFEINLDELPKEGFAKITFDGRDIFIDAKDLKKTFLGGFKNGKDPKTGNRMFSPEECNKYDIKFVSETLHIKDDIELLTQAGHFPRNARLLFENTVLQTNRINKDEFEELRKKYVVKAEELGVNSGVIEEFNEQIESVKNMFFGISPK